MSQPATIDWTTTFRDPTLLLARLGEIIHRPSAQPSNEDSFPSVFEHVLGTKLSVREYWFQLQLHHALAEAFAGPTGWRVLESEPPGVRLLGKLAEMRDARGEPVLKYPDLLVVRGPDDPLFVWWELKWVDSKRKLGRFLVDALLLSKSSNIPRGGGDLAANLVSHMGWKELPDNVVGTHIGVGLAACPLEQLAGRGQAVRMEKLEHLLESFDSNMKGWKLMKSDLPSDFGSALLQEMGWTETSLPTFKALLSEPPFKANVSVSRVQVGKRSLGLICWQAQLHPTTNVVG